MEVSTAGEFPAGVAPRTETGLAFQTIGADVLLEQIAASGVHLIFLDACRGNPLAQVLQKGKQSARSGRQVRGLAPANARQDAFIAFATDPDVIAAVGSDDAHSPFTAALLRHIATPSLAIELMMKNVIEDVRAATGGRQRPWINSSLA